MDPLNVRDNSEYEIFEAFTSYLATNSKKKTDQSQKTDKRILNIALHYFEQELGIQSMHHIRVEHFEQFELWAANSQACGEIIKEPWSPATVLRHGKTIKTIFRKAFLTGRIQRDPTALWRLASVDPMTQRRPMTDAEFELLLSMAQEWFKPVFKMLAATGARPSSIARLKWSDVAFEKQTLYFTSRKGGAKREKRIPFPITSEIRDIFDTLPRHDENHVFLRYDKPITGPLISTTGHRLIKEAGLAGVVIYSLRHKFATDLLRNGTSTEIARRLLGHSNEAMIKNYTSQLGIESLENAVTSMRNSKKVN